MSFKNTFLLLFSLAQFIFQTNKLSSQGIHFSQPENTPLLLNSALAGVMPNDYRIGFNYRTQNAYFSNQEFKTYHIWGDISLTPNFLENGFVGIGASFIEDNTPQSIFNSKIAATSLAYQHRLTEKSLLGIALNLTYNNLSFNKTNQFIFEDQWNGINYDTKLLSKDNLFLPSINFFSIGAGINYTKKINDYDVFHTGFAFYNINQPRQSFILTDKNKNTATLSLPNPIRYSVYANYDYLLNDKWKNKIITYLTWQSGAIESIIGTQFKYLYSNDNASINIGTSYRPNSSLIFSTALEYHDILVGFSYDYNFASTKNYLFFSNAFELSFIANLSLIRYELGNSSLYKRIKCNF